MHALGDDTRNSRLNRTTRVTVDSTEQHRPHRSVEGELQAELQVGHAAYGQSGHRSLTYPVTVTSAYDEVR